MFLALKFCVVGRTINREKVCVIFNKYIFYSSNIIYFLFMFQFYIHQNHHCSLPCHLHPHKTTDSKHQCAMCETTIQHWLFICIYNPQNTFTNIIQHTDIWLTKTLMKMKKYMNMNKWKQRNEKKNGKTN